jgi:hypothetical protein
MSMTRHQFVKLAARTRCPWKREVAKRRRKAWLAKEHKKAIAVALARKEVARVAGRWGTTSFAPGTRTKTFTT